MIDLSLFPEHHTKDDNQNFAAKSHLARYLAKNRHVADNTSIDGALSDFDPEIRGPENDGSSGC